MKKLKCVLCNKSVSSSVPDETVVRSFLTCPECESKHDGRAFFG